MSVPSEAQLTALGASLREIDPSTLAGDDDGSKVRWFLGSDSTELFAWFKPGAPVHHVQLVFARVSVEWSAAKGLFTGTFRGSGSAVGGRHDPYLLSVGRQLDPAVCRAALTLLEASTLESELVEPLRAAIAKALSEPS